jgi:hypothetical protein
VLGWSAPVPRWVLLMDGEMPGVALQERLRRLVQVSGQPLPPPDYFRILAADTLEAGLPDLGSEESQAMFAPTIGDADLIVLDNLATLCRSGRRTKPRVGRLSSIEASLSVARVFGALYPPCARVAISVALPGERTCLIR